MSLTITTSGCTSLNDVADDFAYRLRQYLDKRVIGPEYPSVSKVRNYYIKRIIIRVEKGDSLPAVKQTIINLSDQILSEKHNHSVKILFDPDPQ